MARGSRRGPGAQGADRKRNAHGDVPAVFREMLEEVAESVDPPPSKRRRVGETKISVDRSRPAEAASLGLENIRRPNDMKSYEAAKERPSFQTAVDQTEYSDESEFEWEEVELNAGEQSGDEPMKSEPDEPLSITIGGDETPKQHQRHRVRKPITPAEKKIRLDIHKVHVIFLLFHCFSRNHWCNDAQVQGILRHSGLIPAKLITKLHPSSDAIQFQRSATFKDAVLHMCDIWRRAFTITSSGIARPSWLPSGVDISRYRLSDNNERFLDIRDFRDNAAQLQGSADFGAQLFCALLRALGVEARLVCSLQPLTFTASGPTASPAKTHGKTIVYVADSSDEHSADSIPLKSQRPATDIAIPDVTLARPQPIQRIGRSRADRRSPPREGTPLTVPRRPKSILRPRHPVFWVEVLDMAYQKWIPVDPLATGTVGKPAKLEPALNDPDNIMTYAIAFEEGGIAKDVTRRYAKAYNAKTRKLRVDISNGGEEWFARLMKLFRRRTVLDRDQVEEGALAQRELSEGMPRNIQDFKGHPVYVLERHLRQNEVIHPKREIGKIGQISKSSDSTSQEPIYRRQDVHVVRSADRWFRLGRDVKQGELPIKRMPTRRQRERSPGAAAVDLGEMTKEEVGVYAIFQTEVYIPPPIVDGQVPKNAYGNIDVYVPSMIPPGGVQIRSQNARQAARILNIDYADAVTGFSFKGRQGTAVVGGVVVAAEYKDAMLAVLDGLAYAKAQALEASRTAEALRVWRKFVVGLRIVERVKAYVGDDEEPEDDAAVRQEMEAEMEMLERNEPEEFGGELVLEDEDVMVVESTHPPPPRRRSPPFGVGRRSGRLQRTIDSDAYGGGFLLDEHDEGGFDRDENENAGGFLRDEGKEEGRFLHHQGDGGGGFMTDDSLSDMAKHGDLPASRQNEPGPKSSAPEETRSTDTRSKGETHRTKMSPIPSAESPNHEWSDEADVQSLLSHDPEDDDAEPEWLD